MPHFAANLSLMFKERGFLERFEAAADAGFKAIEFLFPYDYSVEAIGERLSRQKLTQALFNLPPVDWSAGERGLAALPDRFGELQDGVGKALPYVAATGVRRLHLMAGNADPNDPRAIEAYWRSVEWAAREVGKQGVDLVLEPINSRDMPKYFLNAFSFAEKVIRELNISNIKLQFDIYHRQIISGDVIMALRRLMPIIGHIQTASVPGRNEPMTGELNDALLFEELDRLGYSGFVGCEYNPKQGTAEGLGWFSPYAGR